MTVNYKNIKDVLLKLFIKPWIGLTGVLLYKIFHCGFIKAGSNRKNLLINYIMKFSKVSSNGRVTIPVDIRKRYNLTVGSKVKFELTENGILIIPLVSSDEVKANIGFLGTDGKLLKALMEEKERERRS